MLDRRSLLAAGAATLLLPRMALAKATTDQRLVVIVLRGAMDGIGAVIPVGDPAHAALRRQLVVDAPLKLDATFALHPSLAETAKLYAARQALFVHAVATPYRERSHFDAQNILETGGARAYAQKDGWMGRLVGALEPRRKAIAIAPTVPPILRGPVAAASYAPSRLPDASDELLSRVSAMYEADAQLHALWSEAMATRGLAGTGDAMAGRGLNQLAPLATTAAKLLSSADGPRIAVLEHDGWDTHAQQAGRLANQLRQLDGALAALKAGLGAHWTNTLVIAVTEFGRTAAVNGTGGTDHGTASVALLAGGRVAGGRVSGDWPGLRQLHEGRDLRPTTDLNALLLGAVSQHFTADPARLRPVLFPDSAGLKPMTGLLA